MDFFPVAPAQPSLHSAQPLPSPRESPLARDNALESKAGFSAMLHAVLKPAQRAVRAAQREAEPTPEAATPAEHARVDDDTMAQDASDRTSASGAPTIASLIASIGSMQSMSVDTTQAAVPAGDATSAAATSETPAIDAALTADPTYARDEAMAAALRETSPADAVTSAILSGMTTTAVTASITAPAPEGLRAISPELRAKLERVVERMRSEHGYDVTVVEGWRSQSRQDALFAQGRTAPGPVVTWTKDSAHTDGRAVDLMIDGAYTDSTGFARLAAIAEEEGLRALGPKDPGHLELPRSGAELALNPRDSVGTRNGSLTRTPGIAVVSTVATIAVPSAVATISTVATVAQPGVSRVAPSDAGQPGDALGTAARRGARAIARPSADTSATATTARPATATASSNATDKAAAGIGAPSDRRPTNATARERSDEIAARLHSAANASMTRAMSDGGSEADASLRISGPDLEGRVAAIDAARNAQSAQPLRQLIMTMDAAEGGTDRIKVAMRGASVGATMDIADPLAAARLASRVNELSHALEARGLQPESLNIRGALGAPLPSTDPARLAALLSDKDAGVTMASFLQGTAGGTLRDRQDQRTPHHQPSDRGDGRSDGEPSRQQKQRRDGRGDR